MPVLTTLEACVPPEARNSRSLAPSDRLGLGCMLRCDPMRLHAPAMRLIPF